jgi:hypothetical protein
MGFWDDLTKNVRDGLRGDVEDLLKFDGDQLPENPMEMSQDGGAIGSKAIIDDPYFDQVQQHFIMRNKMSRISNRTLKDTSVRDWVVSAIIQARADTMLRLARPQRKQFDMGFKIIKKDQIGNLTNQDRDEISKIEDFIYHCGRKDNTPESEKMLFGEFLKLTCRDALTFGHIAVEKVQTRRGALHRFRPVPAESTFLINKKTDKKEVEKELKVFRELREQELRLNSNAEETTYEYNEPDIDYYKFVQMSADNRVLSAFGDADMIWKNFNPQNFADSLGYCYSPLELAIVNITNHLNIENYNANFFTHGYAARGILHLKGTVTQSQLTAFRRQFYNTISGTQNAWRTPIIAGLDDVQWLPLAGTAKEMEYLNYNNHVIRGICTQFQIDPVELGLDYLASPTGKSQAGSESNESKITYSRERGLFPILMMFEDFINGDILPLLDKSFSEKYEFKFAGLDDETAQTKIALLQAEMTVHASMNDLLKESGKEQIKHVVCDLPLNEAFWGLVEKNMTRGEIREIFLGDKGASKKRELQYLSADPAFIPWQQQLMQMDTQKQQAQSAQEQATQQAQSEQQQAAQEQQQAQTEHEHEKEMATNQDAREQEQHDHEMKQAKTRGAHDVLDSEE